MTTQQERESMAQAGMGYFTPLPTVTEPTATRAHLADIVAALWANGYRPSATLTAPVWGKKTVYLWVNPATDARWELYTTEAGTAQERIITATKYDAAGDTLFKAGDNGETHYKVLRKINSR